MAQTHTSQTRPSRPLELNLISHSLESFLSSPLSQDPHPSLSISNPISLTSSIGLRASPSVPHGLPPWRRLHVRQPPSLSRPSPSTPSPHPSLSISNPNISLTSSIGLRASPSVPHDLPLRLRVILILPLTPNTYLYGYDDDLFDEDSIVKATSSKGASNVVDVD
ncbi:hypothetical protein JHK82_043211 [Glycine max]|nr:hypothetical protein JHK82_043211 [Glycine max]